MARKSSTQPEQVSRDALSAALYESARLVRGLAEQAAWDGDVNAVHRLVSEERRLMNTARTLDRMYGHMMSGDRPY